MLTSVAESISMSYIIAGAQCDLNLKLSDKTVISSISLLGIINSNKIFQKKIKIIY